MTLFFFMRARAFGLTQQKSEIKEDIENLILARFSFSSVYNLKD